MGIKVVLVNQALLMTQKLQNNANHAYTTILIQFQMEMADANVMLVMFWTLLILESAKPVYILIEILNQMDKVGADVLQSLDFLEQFARDAQSKT